MPISVTLSLTVMKRVLKTRKRHTTRETVTMASSPCLKLLVCLRITSTASILGAWTSNSGPKSSLSLSLTLSVSSKRCSLIQREESLPSLPESLWASSRERKKYLWLNSTFSLGS